MSRFHSVVIALVLTAPGLAPAAWAQTAVQPAAPAAAAVDRAATDTARMLAGLPPDPGGRLAAVAARPEWQAWQKEFEVQWTGATRERFADMAVWRDRELKQATGACDTLMYPFAGPDILNAILLFPDCKRYVLFGLEQPGALPDLEKLPADRLASLLDETRKALNDLISRNYFITSHMMKDVAAKELRGVLPLVGVSLVRLNAQILSVKDAEIAEDGKLESRGPSPAQRKAATAVEVVFSRPGHEPQSMVYFRAQAEDAGLPARPGVVPFIEHHAPYVTFLKSASYLLHGADFSIMRKVLLAGSRVVLEDDSGIPFRFFKAPEWKVTLYGRYQKPVKDFNYGYQADMAAAYADPQKVKPLTFSYGYHWAKGDGSVMLCVRNPPAPPAPGAVR